MHPYSHASILAFHVNQTRLGAVFLILLVQLLAEFLVDFVVVCLAFRWFSRLPFDYYGGTVRVVRIKTLAIL